MSEIPVYNFTSSQCVLHFYFEEDPLVIHFVDIPGTDGQDADLFLLPEYVDDDAAIADGLSSGDFYVVLPGNDAIPAGIIKKIL
jgi:hypothetical protein